MLKVTHVREDGGSIIINNGSCISTVVYDDYSGLTRKFNKNDKEFRQFVKRNNYLEAAQL